MSKSKLGICYCNSSGLMSTCIAETFLEQETCDFFEESSGDTKKCMYKSCCLKDHCGCVEAQKFYQMFGIRTLADVRENLQLEYEGDEEELNIEDYIEEEEPASCSNCMKHDQCHGQNGLVTGMNEGQKINVAHNCKSYSPTPVWSQKAKQKSLPF